MHRWGSRGCENVIGADHMLNLSRLEQASEAVGDRSGRIKDQ